MLFLPELRPTMYTQAHSFATQQHSIQPPAMTSSAHLSTLAEQHLVTAVVQALTVQGVRLALVAAPDVRRLARLGQALRAASGWKQVAIGPALSAWLLAQDGAPTPRLLREGLEVCLIGREVPVLCTDLDLLFDPALQLDPLALLRQLSRVRPLAALWPGAYTDGLLAYAVPEHAHYRTWGSVTTPELRIFSLP